MIGEGRESDLNGSSESVEDYNAMFRALAIGSKRFESYVAGVKVANAGAGATMVDNYLKIKKYKKGKEADSEQCHPK